MLTVIGNSISRLGSGNNPPSIFGSSLVGWFQMGNAGVGVSDNVFRTLDTSSGENNVSVLKNQVAGQPNITQATKAAMPQISATSINGFDALNFDAGNSGLQMLSANTVSGTGTSLLTCFVLRVGSYPVSYSRIISVARDSGFDGDANGALCPSGNTGGTGLAVYNSTTDIGSAAFSTGTYRIVTTILDATADTVTCRSAKSVLFGPIAWTNSLNFNKFILGTNNTGGTANGQFLTPELIFASRTGSFTQAQIDAVESYMGGKYGL